MGKQQTDPLRYRASTFVNRLLFYSIPLDWASLNLLAGLSVRVSAGVWLTLSGSVREMIAQPWVPHPSLTLGRVGKEDGGG